ncbi:unnamed protein product [Cladocopium goreaui]|uniref:Uncharacterized protein n=1 Tax=Cladocopium goreaui TaxID=2562237 RepID=A0A9P1FJN0_9DINO|nr:unnamed protein product [Cladocopium goreaui]|mmetsp:Transcript_3394/g.7947  ORF Transcript_3394/g.7947 Transcript_3394/m.7947 type:complete len:267 (+) Transcript_3394:31-831(+)
MPAPGKGSKSKSKGKSKGSDGSTAANAAYSGQVKRRVESSACKFFGSAKGCSNNSCPFQHDDPNSIPFCTFQQRGQCEKGAACTFRHQTWSSIEEAKMSYAARDVGIVERSSIRYKQVRREIGRDGTQAAQATESRLGSEHLEQGEIGVEKDFQEETYGSNAMRMMEKMGYKAGMGLGKENQGRTSLLGSCVALEHSQGTSNLGLSHYAGAGRATAAERAARLADARAKKCQRVDEGSFVHHNLLSSDESSEGEDEMVKSRNVQLL